MKENIHLFNEQLKEELMGCKKEESAIKAFERKLAEKQRILEEMCKAKKNRAHAVNEIRLAKIAEIDQELEESEIELKRLKEETQNLLYAYCKKNGHHYVLIRSNLLGHTGRHTFHGDLYYKENTSKCTTCGTVYTYDGTGYPSFDGCGRRGSKKPSYEQKIPDELYDDTTLREDGKTYRALLKEIEKLEQYISYLQSLYGKICELFGHDAEIVNFHYQTFKCKCCKKSLSKEEYISAHYQAKYRNAVPFYYRDDSKFKLSLEKGEKLVPALPTYKVYQKSLKDKKQ